MAYREPRHITVFKRWYQQLIHSINVKDVIASLFSANCISVRDKERIYLKCDNVGQIEASEILMTDVLLRNPDPDCFNKFTEALQSSNQDYLVQRLKSDYYQYQDFEANRAVQDRANRRAARESQERQDYGHPRYVGQESVPEYTVYQAAAEGRDGQPAGSRRQSRPSYEDDRAHQMEVTGQPTQDATGLGSSNAANNEYDNEQVAIAAATRMTKIRQEHTQMEEQQREQSQGELKYPPAVDLFADVANDSFVPFVETAVLNLDYSKRLGKGGSGIVFQGTYKDLDVAVKEVALKINKRSKKKAWEELCKEQLTREFQVSVYVRHANVALLMAYALEKEALFLVYELIDGHNMEQVIFHDEISCLYRLDKKEKFFLTSEIVQALAFLHQCNPKVIHGDVKPANMMVTRDKKTAKICDMGLSKLKERNAVTTTGGNLSPGTPMYMAKEQLIEGKRSTTRTDIWSIGASMYEIFFEEEVWDVNVADALKGVKKMLEADRKPEFVEKPEERYRDVAQIIGKCMQPLDTDRPDALEVQKDLWFAEKKYLNAQETNGD